MILGFIPVNQNERFVEAYRKALAQSGGKVGGYHSHRVMVLGKGFGRIYCFM